MARFLAEAPPVSRPAESVQCASALDALQPLQIA
jgi:hypothetical protein